MYESDKSPDVSMCTYRQFFAVQKSVISFQNRQPQSAQSVLKYFKINNESMKQSPVSSTAAGPLNATDHISL